MLKDLLKWVIGKEQGDKNKLQCHQLFFFTMDPWTELLPSLCIYAIPRCKITHYKNKLFGNEQEFIELSFEHYLSTSSLALLLNDISSQIDCFRGDTNLMKIYRVYMAF